MRFEKLMTTLCYAIGCGTLLITVLAGSCYALTHRLMQMPDHLVAPL